MIILIYIICALELFGYFVVLLIFMTRIEVKSKKNLRFFSEIAMRIAKRPGRRISLPTNLTAISKRLYEY